jgi:hypothetical protein
MRLLTPVVPAVCELGAHCLQVRVAHVLDRKDEDMLKLVRGFLHIGKKFLRQLLALLVRLGEMYDLLALGFRHVGGFGVVVVGSNRAQEKKFAVPENQRGIFGEPPNLAAAAHASRRRSIFTPHASHAFYDAAPMTETCWISWKMCSMHSTRHRTGMWTTPTAH